MDLLLSVPLISTFFTPSWSTSLNILFFYATWTTLVLAHGATTIHASALLALRVVLWLAPSLLFLAFDSLLPSLAGSIKFAGPSSLPRSPPWRLLGLAVFNMLLVTGVEASLSFGYSHFFSGGEAFFRTTTTLPLPWQVLKHVVALAAAREVITYYTHRFLLHAGKSSRLSALHSRYAHASPQCSLQLYGDHPLPLLVMQLLPVLLPAVVVRPHLLTYILFTALSTLEGTLATSGYSIVPGFFLGGIARRTAVHYASRGSANYGAWGFLDFAHGTSKGGDVLADVKDEADKHHVKERSAEKVDDGAGLLQNGIDAVKNGTATRRSTRKRTPKKAD